jgi:hypothetical protein
MKKNLLPALAIGLLLTMPALTARAQYTVTLLSAPGFQITAAQGSQAGKSVGIGEPINGNMNYHALLWTGQNSVIDLHPSQFYASIANSTDGQQQGGYGKVAHGLDVANALLWKGTAASVVNLHDPGRFYSSAVYGLYNGQQVGVASPGGVNHAALWRGTADSVVVLHPQGFFDSLALAANGSQQFGYGSGLITDWHYHALLWSGEAESYQDLNPSGFAQSFGFGIDANQQVGSGRLEGQSDTHALLWNGSAQSVIDLDPEGFDFTVASDVWGGIQVGYGFGPVTNHEQNALLWRGEAESYVNLHAFLPAGFSYSAAYSIDEFGVVTGAASGESGTYAVRWTPVVVVPEPNSGGLFLSLLSGCLLLMRSAFRRKL